MKKKEAFEEMSRWMAVGYAAEVMAREGLQEKLDALRKAIDEEERRYFEEDVKKGCRKIGEPYGVFNTRELRGMLGFEPDPSLLADIQRHNAAVEREGKEE